MRHAAVYEEEELAGSAAELNLGMGTLVGIFFGLALVCGVFFGFGYMMGHRTPGAYVSSQPLYEAAKPVETAAAPKPSALIAEQPAVKATTAPTSPDSYHVVLPVAPESDGALAKPSSNVEEARSQTASAPAVQISKPVATLKAPAMDASTPAAASIGTIMVQIAAVKSRSDAEALASALRRNGFTPTIRTEPQDKLLRVQIGPFAGRDEAKAMRQKLSEAGYDAFLK